MRIVAKAHSLVMLYLTAVAERVGTVAVEELIRLVKRELRARQRARARR